MSGLCHFFSILLLLSLLSLPIQGSAWAVPSVKMVTEGSIPGSEQGGTQACGEGKEPLAWLNFSIVQVSCLLKGGEALSTSTGVVVRRGRC